MELATGMLHGEGSFAQTDAGTGSRHLTDEQLATLSVAERHQLVMDMRQDGHTFAQIAAKLGVSPARASQLYYRASYLQRQAASISGEPVRADSPIANLALTIRTRRTLENAGYRTVSQIWPCDAAKQRELLLLPNFSRNCLNEVQAVLADFETGEA